DGECAEGGGVCCDFTEGGDTTIGAGGGVFQVKGYPDPNSRAGENVATLQPPAGTVQVKLTFEDFEMMPPVDGDCTNDTFVFVGANPGTELPVLCGFNTGQHMYIDVDNSEGPWSLVSTKSGEDFPRRYKVKVDYLSASDPGRAPFRCLQHYPEKEGEMSSFNYNKNG
ncbi:unnamed protein product, partial [Meganyctiphanes norvegica]